MSFAYAAHTHACTFLLDDGGICRRVLLHQKRLTLRSSEGHPGDDDETRAARRCIGAQYVASLDVRTEGGLVPMPRVGSPMLFAVVGDDGRVAIVRSGALVRFDSLEEPDSGVRSLPDADVEDDDGGMTVPIVRSGQRKSFVEVTDSAPTLVGSRSRQRGIIPSPRLFAAYERASRA
jgi:hypothetical protein